MTVRGEDLCPAHLPIANPFRVHRSASQAAPSFDRRAKQAVMARQTLKACVLGYDGLEEPEEGGRRARLRPGSHRLRARGNAQEGAGTAWVTFGPSGLRCSGGA